MAIFTACGMSDAVIGGEGDDKLDDSQLAKQELIPGSRIHVMPKHDANAALLNASAAQHLTYYGGKIIPNVKVLSVNWGSSVNATVKNGAPGFYGAIITSNMFDWLAEYSTVGKNGSDGQPGSNQTLGHGTFAGTVTLTPSITSTSITDAQIQNELSAQIASGVLPAPDDNTYYAINFPKGVKISNGTEQSCVAFCAYHGTFQRGSQNVYYGVLPSLEAGTGCDTG